MLHLNTMAQKAKAITINEVLTTVQEAFATESMSSVQKWAGTICCFFIQKQILKQGFLSMKKEKK
ncbi:MAG: hypothetical protein EAZ55_02740 [Cytophagales bacterium]|nr:MAG: hypothetical protein EAZ55_02740 [Cytophagales bacterium]